METFLDYYKTIKVTSEIKRAEYTLWKDNFPGLNFISNSRLTKIFGPIELNLDFNTDIDKLTYSASIFLSPITRSTIDLMFSTNSIKDSRGKDILFVYYPFNEEKEIIENFYTKVGLNPPQTQLEKTDAIKQTLLSEFDFSKDLSIDNLIRLLEISNPLFSGTGTKVRNLIIKIYAYLYLNDLVTTESFYIELSEELNLQENIAITKDAVLNYLKTIRNDIDNREEYLKYLAEYKGNKKYNKIEMAELIK